MSRAVGVVPSKLPPYVDVKWTFDELTNTGASGDPTKATKEKGKKMREVLVDAMVKVIEDLDKNNWDYRSPEVK
jgi:creatinine amidohydrolase